jgi:CheY-like chemotaxis protein
MPEIELPQMLEQTGAAPAGALPIPPSPFTVAETFQAPVPEPPAFSAEENGENMPPAREPSAANRVASAQEIEQSLRPAQICRLLLAVSRPERMAQLNTLVRSAGYEVRPAFDGPHTLGLLRIDRPDILLLDYEVRGLNGLETLHRIQAQHSGRLPVPVILLTSDASPEIKTEAEALGVVKVLPIPYSPIELLAAMRQAVSNS